MTTYTKPTGAQGTMRIDDNPDGTVDLYLLGVNELVEQVPWGYVLDGVYSSVKSFRLEANLAWQKLVTLYVGTTQTIHFGMDYTGNAKLGGPTDFALDVQRSGVAPGGTPGGLARVNVDGVNYQAIPYVNDQGVWKELEPWVRQAGVWRPTG